MQKNGSGVCRGRGGRSLRWRFHLEPAQEDAHGPGCAYTTGHPLPRLPGRDPTQRPAGTGLGTGPPLCGKSPATKYGGNSVLPSQDHRSRRRLEHHQSKRSVTKCRHRRSGAGWTAVYPRMDLRLPQHLSVPQPPVRATTQAKPALPGPPRSRPSSRDSGTREPTQPSQGGLSASFPTAAFPLSPLKLTAEDKLVKN